MTRRSGRSSLVSRLLGDSTKAPTRADLPKWLHPRGESRRIRRQRAKRQPKTRSTPPLHPMLPRDGMLATPPPPAQRINLARDAKTQRQPRRGGDR